jgi:tRNA modification GTPase
MTTITALATPLGRGGIGVVRISGPKVAEIARRLLGQLPQPRYATFSNFLNSQGELLDQGIALYFPAPHSFTGEDVLELQGHGGPVIMDLLLKAILTLGARLAHPGEFSERAFLNGKIDLAQAEAIADLIDSSSKQAATCALRSLQGEFSAHIHALVDQLIWLRTYIEASIDFADEEIDHSANGQLVEKIEQMLNYLDEILEKAHQGYLLKEGMHIVLIGEPNVGKSSLLNSLAGRETAIVTAIPGTTRDIIRDQIQLEGMPLHIIDTAGLRQTNDPIEKEGIRRTKLAMNEADLIILLQDNDRPFNQELLSEIDKPDKPLLRIRNKIDLSGQTAGFNPEGILYLSAKTGEGIPLLKTYLKNQMGLQANTEGHFMARRRHLEALQAAKKALTTALTLTHTHHTELLAEELRLAQHQLGEITGEFTTEDLLGEIFSSFCLGK